MKKLLALSSVVLLAGVVKSFAALGMGDIKFDGSLEVTGVSANNEVDHNNKTGDQRGVTGDRVRLGMDAQVTEGVMGRVEIARAPYNPNGGADANALYGKTAESVSTVQTEFYIQNAYVELQDLWGAKAKLGRQYTGEAGDLVWNFGPKSDDAMTITNVEGLDLKRSWADKVDVDLFTGKTNESAASFNGNAQTDANVNNLAIGIKNVLPNGTINLGWGYGVQDAATTKLKARLQLARLGVKGGVMENMWTYRAEYLQDMGDQSADTTKVKYQGSAYDLGVGLNLKDLPAGKFSFALNYTMASGDDKVDDKDKAFHDLGAIAGSNTSDRYFGEIFGRDGALNKGGLVAGGQGLNQGVQGGADAGLKVLNIGAKYVPPVMDGKLSAMADYYMLGTDKKVNVGTANDSDKIGNEIDLALGYAHTANVNIQLGYAMLSVDKAIQPTSPRDSVTKLFSRLNVKWGSEEK